MEEKQRITNWINNILTEVSKLEANKGIEMLNACGKSCCENSDLLKAAIKTKAEFTSDTHSDAIFNIFKENYYNSPLLSKKANTIRLIFEECTCPMVKEGVSNAFLCNCTMGYSKQIFEALFGKPVTVELEESILRGDTYCKQIITIEEN